MFQGYSAIEELWPTSLNTLGTCGGYIMSFRILSTQIPSSLQRAAGSSILWDRGKLEGKIGN